jgi:lysine 2,3-aminomutase
MENIKYNPPFRISNHLKKIIRKNDDPIGIQFIPSTQELAINEKNKCEDFQADMGFQPVKGLTHRCPHKALLFPSWQCFSYCRFCFRRDLLGREKMTKDEINCAIRYIENTRQLNEIILSGGDPFTLSDSDLQYILTKIKQISHIKFIRIHTRVLTHFPERINEETIKMLLKYKNLSIVLHVNHINEITNKFKIVINKLKANIHFYSQSVLLKGVNDNLKVLLALFEKLLEIGVNPYYLYHCDPIHEIKHFRIPLAQGIKLYRKLHNHISGLALPKYVLELPNGNGKVLIDIGYIVKKEKKDYLFQNDHQKLIKYNDNLF